jgi:hypothetical protein
MPNTIVGSTVRKSARYSLDVTGVVSTLTSEPTRYGPDDP